MRMSWGVIIATFPLLVIACRQSSAEAPAEVQVFVTPTMESGLSPAASPELTPALDASRACPVADETFCDFVDSIAAAIAAGDGEAFISHVAFRPWTCSGHPGYVQSCYGKPEGTVIECALAAALQGEGTCATKAEYASRFFPDFQAVYAVAYPSSEILSEMLQRHTGPLVLVRTPDDFRDVALEMETSKHGWDISWTYGFIVDEACVDLGGCLAEDPLLVPWP